MKPLNTFHSVDAPAGSGKTYQALRWALTQAAVHHQKTVIIFKSIELLRQAQRDADTFQRFSSHLVAVRAIHSKSADALVGDYSVSAAIAEHLSQSKQGKGEILMITEAALLNQAYWPNRWRRRSVPTSTGQKWLQGRPKADIQPLPRMLRCGPSNLPFAAQAKSDVSRTQQSRT